jgi:histidyl-tRNA synthetase
MSSTPTPISGHPELLPDERAAELAQLDAMRSSYEDFGYGSLETSAVERLEHLTAKGGAGRQIFTLARLGQDSKAKLGLHFDLTVPLARYIAQHAHEVSFPFKRHQIQKVWRGERAQRGRYREFVQADIDVIGDGHLDPMYDAEILAVMARTLTNIGLTDFTMHVSNRSVLGALLRARGLEDMETPILQEIDKLLLADERQVADALLAIEVPQAAVDGVLDLIGCDTAGDCINVLDGHGAAPDGAAELQTVVETALVLGLRSDQVKLNLRIARGLDYYTGTVFETFADGYEHWGSVCSGGRYDDLARHFTDRRLPGVGASIGHTRLFRLMLDHSFISPGSQAPTRVLVISDEEGISSSDLRLASFIRDHFGQPTEVLYGASSRNEQVAYARAKGIPFLVTAGDEAADGDDVEVIDVEHGANRRVSRDRLEEVISSTVTGTHELAVAR